jgi:CRP/FNR family transcriptional regulator, cyclic AMP receptor protein
MTIIIVTVIGDAGPPNSVVSRLRNLRLFERLGPQELHRMAGFMDTRNYRPGECIFEADEQADRLYFVDRGIIKITIASLEGEERVLDVVTAGNVFGEPFLSKDNRRTVAAHALTAATIRTMSVETFMSVMEDLPALCIGFVDHLIDLQRRTLGRLNAQMQKDRGVRMLAVLLDLAERCGHRIGDDYALPDELTQVELARMIGLHRSAVSLLLNYYRRMGVLGGRGSAVVIHSAPAEALLRKAGALLS